MRRFARGAAVAALVILCAPVRAGAGTPLADPRPPRTPALSVGLEPWPGAWPWEAERRGPVPLAGAGDSLRWSGWTAPLPPRAAVPPRVVETPLNQPPVPGESFLARELPPFRQAWNRAVAAAEAGEAAGVRAALDGVNASTAEGAARVRELQFAAAVAAGDRSAADSLFYRMSWDDGGRTAARLLAWRALDEGKGGDADRALAGLQAPTAGERAAGALARWMADPAAPDPTLGGAEAGGLAGAALALARAHSSLAAGHPGQAARELEAVDAAALPEAWLPIRDALAAAAAPPGEAAGPADAAGYAEAARALAAGDPARAGELLDRWLAAWPASPYRPQAYLLRAQARLAAGDPDGAGSDLRAAEVRGDPETVERARLVRAFVLADRGRAAEARTTFGSVLDGPLGRAAEPELLFDRIRLALVNGSDSVAVRTRLRLEEGYPDGPWPARARADTVASGWRTPWPVLPPEPGEARTVEPPRRGPWSLLLWGEAVLPHAAARVKGAGPGPRPQVIEPPDAAGASPPPAGPGPGRGPRTVVGVAGGGPAAVLLNGGVGGEAGALRYRATLGGAVSSQAHDLPNTRRWQGEGVVGGSAGAWSYSASAEWRRRSDDAAPAARLLDHRTVAGWRAVRADLSRSGSGAVSGSAYLALARGTVDTTGSGRWRTGQIWGGGTLALRLGGAVWEGALKLGGLDQRQPGYDDFTYLYRDLRVVRRDPAGWYLGARASGYHERALLLPVAGIRRDLAGGWRVWAASEPELQLPAFAEEFVMNGDADLPDLALPAQRRDLDLKGGLAWSGAPGDSAAARVEVFHAGEFRSWRREGDAFVERTLGGVRGSRVVLDGSTGRGGVRLGGSVTFQQVTHDGDRVPYVPRVGGSLELGLHYRGWRWGLTARGLGGREDEGGDGYGSYLRWDADAGYRIHRGDLPLGARWVEFTLRVRNLTDVRDRRWPGVPGYGIGIYGGVQAAY